MQENDASTEDEDPVRALAARKLRSTNQRRHDAARKNWPHHVDALLQHPVSSLRQKYPEPEGGRMHMLKIRAENQRKHAAATKNWQTKWSDWDFPRKLISTVKTPE